MTPAPTLIPVRKIHVSKLFVDTSYQRIPDSKRVARIVGNFDAHAFQVLEVSARPNGKFAVFDGGHKLAAARILGYAFVYCRVHTGLSVADEAMYFNMLQTERKRLTQMEMFNADLVRGYEPALRIQRIVDSEGFRIDERRDGGSLSFIPGLYRADSLGVLSVQLRVIRRAWGVQTGDKAVQSQKFMRLTKIIAVLPKPINEDALVSVLDTNQYAGMPHYQTLKVVVNDYIANLPAPTAEAA